MWLIPSYCCHAGKSLCCSSPLKFIWFGPSSTFPSPTGSSGYKKHTGKYFFDYLQKRCFLFTVFTETHVVTSQLLWTEKALQAVLLRRQRRFLSVEFLQARFLFLLCFTRYMQTAKLQKAYFIQRAKESKILFSPLS